MMQSCFVFSASCYVVEPSSVLDLVCIVRRCLMLSTSRYAAEISWLFFYRMCCCWMSSIHFMLHHLILFLWCKPPGTSCESDWCPLHNVTLRVSVRDATLFDFIQVILRRFTTFHTSCCLAFSIPIFSSEFDQVFSMLFDFVINTLRCLIVSNSLRPWPAGVMLVSVVYVMVHVAPDLRDAALFDLFHLLLRFLGLPTLCNVA